MRTDSWKHSHSGSAGFTPPDGHEQGAAGGEVALRGASWRLPVVVTGCRGRPHTGEAIQGPFPKVPSARLTSQSQRKQGKMRAGGAQLRQTKTVAQKGRRPFREGGGAAMVLTCTACTCQPDPGDGGTQGGLPVQGPPK